MNRKEILNAIKAELSAGIRRGGYVKRVGNVFFRENGLICAPREMVYYRSRRHELNFELLEMGAQCFFGTKEHAMALKEKYGGVLCPTKFLYLSEEPRDLWIWEGPDYGKPKRTPIDFAVAKSVLFDED